jgi:hypothetical protein
MSVETIYSLWGSKYKALEGQDQEGKNQNDWRDLAGQQRKLLVHRSQLDTYTTYLRNEVELDLLQEHIIE